MIPSPIITAMTNLEQCREEFGPFLAASKQQYKQEQYAELAVWMSCLQALNILHQSHHWQTMGKEFYADHLLFERLYDATIADIDMLAEKLVGVGSIKLTNYFSHIKHIHDFLSLVNRGKPLIEESYRGECLFVAGGELVMEQLKQQGLVTTGVEQAIGNVLDKHEGSLYLLKQRVGEM
jgi:hypothetical protein